MLTYALSLGLDEHRLNESVADLLRSLGYRTRLLLSQGCHRRLEQSEVLLQSIGVVLHVARIARVSLD